MTAKKRNPKAAGATRGSKTSKSDPNPPKAPAVAKAVPEENLVVFAFRLTREERDVIHAATGPSKASRFVRTLAVAGARGDEQAIREILDSIKLKPAA